MGFSLTSTIVATSVCTSIRTVGSTWTLVLTTVVLPLLIGYIMEE